MTDSPSIVFIRSGLSVGFSNKEANYEKNIEVQKRSAHKNSIQSRKRKVVLKKLLEALNDTIVEKMVKIESNLDVLLQSCNNFEQKINVLSSLHESNNKVIQQNCTDHPEGSWLGFVNKPKMRVRCKIKPRDLREINKNCSTPEKLALTLLDHLFDKDTQACSNISGLGKHKKSQLNPFLIHGIKCHLMCYFDVTDEHWARIKVLMDSKCRTAFRKKLREKSLLSKVQ